MITTSSEQYFKSSIFIFSFLLLCSFAEAQTHQLKGSFILPISGKVYLVPAISDEKYYGSTFKVDSAKVTEGSFILNRNTNEKGIFPFILLVESDKVNGATNMIFLSSNDQEIIIDTVNNYKSPNVAGSLIQSEMNAYYDVYFKNIVSDIRRFIRKSEKLENKYQGNLPEREEKNLLLESQELQRKGDSLSLGYTRSHPNSFVTLWKLIERFKNNGYKEQYLEMFNLLSTDLKKTSTANLLLKEMLTAGKTAEGKIFPDLKLKTENRQETSISFSNKQKGLQYVLVDLWFHNCVPCLRQFPMLKELYDDYRYAGFEVIGISIDKKEDFNKWTEAIKKENLKWPNYLDANGVNAESMAINYFPFNFLLNDKGEIIKKNISIYDLKSLLEQNLKIADNIRNIIEPD